MTSATDTPNYIELNSNGSQPWQKDTNSSIYSGYKFDKKKGCWLWCRVSGNKARLFFFGDRVDMTSIEAANFDVSGGVWVITDTLELYGQSIENWVKTVLARSIDGSREYRAYIRTREEAPTGIEAIKLFRVWFKVLNEKSKRIDTAMRLFPNETRENLFNLTKKGDIHGVSGKVCPKHLLFQQYLLDACNGYTDLQGTYHPARTSKDVDGGIEFDNLIEWYLPSIGVFPE